MADSAFKIVVLISGRGSNLRALVERLEVDGGRAAVAGVISDKRSAAGLEYAGSRNIPWTVVPREAGTCSAAEFNTRLADAAANYRPDLIVLAGFMRIVTVEFLQRFPQKVINIHPSLLPSFRGLRAQRQALEAGAKLAGCSVHYVTEDIDGGPIIAQAAVPVLAGDDEAALTSRILRCEHMLLPEVVLAIAKGDVCLEQNSGRMRVKTGSRLQADSEDRLFSIGEKL